MKLLPLALTLATLAPSTHAEIYECRSAQNSAPIFSDRWVGAQCREITIAPYPVKGPWISAPRKLDKGEDVRAQKIDDQRW